MHGETLETGILVLYGGNIPNNSVLVMKMIKI